MSCILSIDVEDWFHILDVDSTPDLAHWEELPSRVERNFTRLLDLLDAKRVPATCFFLGWVADRFPHLVLEADRRGHEIASHGYAHTLVYRMTPEAFYQDARRARELLEKIVGRPVAGYRAPGFSVTEQTPWFFQKLHEAGYRYSSSVFPAARGHGGLRANRLEPYAVACDGAAITEVPITVRRVLGKRICFFGGGYLRLFPYRVIRDMTRSLLAEGRPVVFYVHPREIDPDQPRLAMGPARRFKSYVNLRTTEDKLRRLLDEFEFTTFERYLADAPPAAES
ncbi:MAG: polysaccharide deacetylase family protein [Deltaproteobacteria bacterium]|nr:MAG: polysaccharide deacetylase family protein [Deltaproteobacteria bacterium]